MAAPSRHSVWWHAHPATTCAPCGPVPRSRFGRVKVREIQVRPTVFETFTSLCPPHIIYQINENLLHGVDRRDSALGITRPQSSSYQAQLPSHGHARAVIIDNRSLGVPICCATPAEPRNGVERAEVDESAVSPTRPAGRPERVKKGSGRGGASRRPQLYNEDRL